MKPDIKGLMKLGRFLRSVPRKQFNQGIWWRKIEDSQDKSSCGTAGCVAGWAATVFPHRFKRIDGGGVEFGTRKEIMYDVMHRRSGDTGTEAFANGFRISYDDAYNITDGDAHNNSPKRAGTALINLAKRLRAEMKRNK